MNRQPALVQQEPPRPLEVRYIERMGFIQELGLALVRSQIRFTVLLADFCIYCCETHSILAIAIILLALLNLFLQLDLLLKVFIYLGCARDFLVNRVTRYLEAHQRRPNQWGHADWVMGQFF
jgi:hypothetical protein